MSVIGIAMDRWRPASASATGDQRSWRLARGWIWTHFSHGRMREAWNESAERGRRERSQHLTGAGGRTRADTKRPSCPSGELDQGQNLRLASIPVRSPTAMPVPAFSGHESGEQAQSLSRPRAAGARGCPNHEQDRWVKLGLGTQPASVLRRNRWLKPQTIIIRARSEQDCQ